MFLIWSMISLLLTWYRILLTLNDFIIAWVLIKLFITNKMYQPVKVTSCSSQTNSYQYNKRLLHILNNSRLSKNQASVTSMNGQRMDKKRPK